MSLFQTQNYVQLPKLLDILHWCWWYIVGEVKEKEQAHREYKEAISKGHGAYLMDEEKPVS